jgi:cytochrome c oxidase subunit 2
MKGLPFWPEGASTLSPEVDRLFIGLLIVSALVLILVFGLMTTFAVRYRRGSAADRDHRVKKSWHWEVSWTSATFLAFVGLFYWGADLYTRLLRPPPGTAELFVLGKQWMWKVEHPGGQSEIDELHVPVGRPVRLVMTSQDVIHSFFLPAFRLKRDVLPGRYETLWFQPSRVGEYPILCAEFCGLDHSHMIGRVVVMSEEGYADWLKAQPPGDSMAAAGAALFRQLGCSGCHEGRGPVRAPRLDGLWGRTVPLQDGSTVLADERYVRDSILQPKREIAAGYEPVMPSFAGQIGEHDLLKLLAYIQSLASKRPVP